MITKKYIGSLTEAIKKPQTLARIETGEGEFDEISLVLGERPYIYLDTMYRGDYDIYPEDGETIEQAYINILILEELFTRKLGEEYTNVPAKEMIAAVKKIIWPTTEEEVVEAVSRYLSKEDISAERLRTLLIEALRFIDEACGNDLMETGDEADWYKDRIGITAEELKKLGISWVFKEEEEEEGEPEQ